MSDNSTRVGTPVGNSPDAHDLNNVHDGGGFYIRTWRGHQFYWDNIPGNVIDIFDIAHALSLNCRWTGHTSFFYSVAQHCILASKFVDSHDPRVKMQALLHDANEAYLHDMPSPLKWYLATKGFTLFTEMEKQIDETVAATFNVPFPFDPAVKVVDRRLLSTEHRDLIPIADERERAAIAGSGAPFQWPITRMSAGLAEEEYIRRFRQLEQEIATLS